MSENEKRDDAQARMDAYRAAMDEDPDRWYEHQALLMDGPPDYTLLTDPYGVLTDATRMPAYISEAVMRESLFAWLQRTLIAVGGEDDDHFLCSAWPFPVGRLAFDDDPGIQEDTKLRSRLRLKRMLPFTGNEYAALVLSVEQHGVVVDIFGIVIMMRGENGEPESYECAPAQIHWRGASPYLAPGNKVEPFVRAAVRWWATIGTVAFPKSEDVGRPEVTFTLEDLTAHIHAYSDVAAASGDRPTQTGLAAHIGCDVKTLRKALRRHSIKLR